MIILSQHENPDPEQTGLEREIIERCQTHGFDYLLIPPLYHIAEASDLWNQLAEVADRAVLLGWLHPRPVCWLLRRHNIAIDQRSILNLAAFRDAQSAWTAATSVAADKPHGCGQGKTIRETTKPRWYPVVDGSRCIQCKHCLQFCLFGVYALDADGKVQVRNPDQCKPGCPACARICPQSAIMFPLYEQDAAIAGAPGQLVTLDAAARRMFYARSEQPCPVCGRKVDRKSLRAAASGDLCPECGCPKPAAPPANRAPFDDLDLLVDQLDQAMQRRR